MATTYIAPAVQQPTHTLRRQPSRWRMRLSRFIRGQKRSKGVYTDTVASTAPRLAPIGSTTTSKTYGNIADDLATLRFDDKGELGKFDFSFDTPNEFVTPKRDVSGGSEREPGLLQLVEVKRISKSAAGERVTKTHVSAPSIDLPRDEDETDKSFFDAWLLNAVQQGKLAELKDDEPAEGGTVIKRQSVSTRTPIATQFATVAPPIASQFTTGSRPSSMALSNKAESNQQFGANDKSNSPGQKRKADDDAPTSPSKRGSIIRPNLSAVSTTAQRGSEDSSSGVPARGGSLRQSANNMQDMSSKRYSANYEDPRGRCPPVSIKRYSMGSDYGGDFSNRSSTANKRYSTGASLPLDALKVDHRRPSAVPSLIDSESASSASTSPTMATSFASVTPAKRFEIKSASLLTPVTNAIADKQTANISDQNTRINHGIIPRSTADGYMGGSSSRSGSRHTVSNSYAGGSRSASPAGLSRATTPEPGTYADATPRARRPSSRLSDRMSWLRELDEHNAKQTGRDFVFRKMEGGVAAKLAAFEHKKSANGASASGANVGAGRSRANSNSSRQCSSELYSIESNKLTRRATTEAPGNINKVVNDDFKQKLESMTGFMAEKISKGPQGKQAVSGDLRGLNAMTAARRKIPQDVLDFIALSGVDPEVAINEYMQQGAIGKTKEWDHDEIVKQISQLETHEPTSPTLTPAQVKSSETDIAAAAPATKELERPVTPVNRKETEAPMPSSAAEATSDSKLPSTPVRSTIVDGVLSPPQPDDSFSPVSTPAKLENARMVVVKAAEMPRTIDIKPFNAAALPNFA